jgi:hypothetical protein
VNPKITILGGLSLILAATPATSTYLETSYTALISGFAVLAYLASSKLLDRKILEESTSRKAKAFQDLITTLSIFLIIGSAGLADITPVWLTVSTVGLLGAVKVFQLQMSRRYRKSFRLGIGQDYWLTLIALILLGSHLNSYFLFYGLIVLNLVLIYDTGSLVRKIKR